MAKFRPPSNQTKYISFERLIVCQKLLAFLSIFASIYDAHSPNMVMSRANFEKFLFCYNSKFNIGKSHNTSSGKAFHFRSHQQKTHGACGKHPPSAFRVKKIGQWKGKTFQKSGKRTPPPQKKNINKNNNKKQNRKLLELELENLSSLMPTAFHAFPSYGGGAFWPTSKKTS